MRLSACISRPYLTQLAFRSALCGLKHGGKETRELVDYLVEANHRHPRSTRAKQRLQHRALRPACVRRDGGVPNLSAPEQRVLTRRLAGTGNVFLRRHKRYGRHRPVVYVCRAGKGQSERYGHDTRGARPRLAVVYRS